MAGKSTNLFATIADFVRKHPKTSATVAFNLGVMAANATKRVRKATPDMSEIPAKLIEMVPSLKDLTGHLPESMGGRPARKPRRRKTKRSTATRGVKRRRKVA